MIQATNKTGSLKEGFDKSDERTIRLNPNPNPNPNPDPNSNCTIRQILPTISDALANAIRLEETRLGLGLGLGLELVLGLGLANAIRLEETRFKPFLLT